MYTIQRRKMSAKFLHVILVILAYWSISISMVFANKYLVGSRSSEGDLSLFIVWIQCIITVLLVVSGNACKAVFTKDWSKVPVRLETLCLPPVMKMTVSFVCMLSLNNLCLKHVGVPFYQVARSMTLIFVVILSVTMLKKHVSVKVWLCCFLVAGGFVLGIDQENLLGTLSVRGVVYGVAASVFVALNGIFTKQALDLLDGDSVKLTVSVSLNAVFLFIPIIVLSGQFQQAVIVPAHYDLYFWSFLIVTGGLSFLIAWISAVQIHLTSPLSHHIIANIKAVLQTLIAVMYYHEFKSALWWISILLVIGGAFTYAVVKIKEEDKNRDIKIGVTNGDVEMGKQPANLTEKPVPNGLIPYTKLKMDSSPDQDSSDTKPLVSHIVGLVKV